jgi:asparagine synthase (glutamine-hydrolysing)
MCGICGVVWAEPGQGIEPSAVHQMNSRLVHRGPDEEGFYAGEQAMLAMRRLSIIDLETGQQPVSDEARKLWLVFNGEIYNYREQRRALEQAGHLFRSQSDSEVVVHAYEEYGAACLERLNGMFALAIWDEARRQLFLARDRLGIKPLYYWTDGQRLAFASELKALLACPDVPSEVDLVALDQFLTLEYIPAPRTIFAGVCKLPAGHWLTFDDRGVQLQRYWDAEPATMPATSKAGLIEILQELLADAVQMQMVSDVPIGAFLSGGIDSSTVVAFMRQATTATVRTFSIGFDDATYNELPYARQVAGAFATEHHEELLQPDIAAMAEELVAHFDEPFADFSLFPTYLVSQMARRSVKVVLSGDGGDELFGGYDTYRAQQADRYYRRLPAAVRYDLLPAVFSRIRPRAEKKGLVNKAKRFVQGGQQPAALQHARWMMFLDAADKKLLYTPELRSALASLNGCAATAFLSDHFERAAHLDPLAQQQYVDIKTYLVDDILTKVDRMSMATSLEVRVPLLDHRLVEFALGLPPHLKLHRGTTKLILREAMKGRLPEAVLDKPKEGFSIPLKHWLRGPLQPLMADLLANDSILRRGYFAPQTVSVWMDEHLSGRANHSHRLWALMVLELWHRQVLDRRGVSSLAASMVRS